MPTTEPGGDWTETKAPETGSEPMGALAGFDSDPMGALAAFELPTAPPGTDVGGLTSTSPFPPEALPSGGP